MDSINENEEIEYSLTVEAVNINLPTDMNDEVLFLTIKKDLLEILNDKSTEITYF